MDDQPEVTLDHLQQMLEMLRRAVEAGSDLDRRVGLVEKAARETFNVMRSLQENQEALLKAFETQSNAQNKLNADLTSVVQRLTEDVGMLRGGGLVM